MSSTNSFDAIVVGAGVVGPAIATGLARQGRRVLLIERDWKEPNRIVGELMQPGGIRALRTLGMVQAVNNIDAVPCIGYTMFYNGDKVVTGYPPKSDCESLQVIESCVFDGNDKLLTDSTISEKMFEEDENERGVSLQHGKFITNMRNIAKAEPNITTLEGTVIDVNLNENDKVHGVMVQIGSNPAKLFTSDLTVICDGIFSKFRKVLSQDYAPVVESHFIALMLKDAVIPVKHTGHIILNENVSPVLLYQTTPTDTRVLCAYNDKKLPKNPKQYLRDSVLPSLPKELQPSFEKALDEDQPLKSMPNSYLPAKENNIPGLLVLGDALNMRHPLGGGGMTIGLNDVSLIVRLFENVPSLKDIEKVTEAIKEFHKRRINYDSVINIVSSALYSLFAANNSDLRVLQRGTFEFFKGAGEDGRAPVGIIAGVVPKPLILSRTFFKVAFYSIYLNFQHNGLAKLPLSIIQIFTVFFTTVRVFIPYLYTEWLSVTSFF